ncbi:TPA: phage tail family protein, partial [Staphylococcus aureus]|nr:phage tail family protein [Staphylococcus aureus]
MIDTIKVNNKTIPWLYVERGFEIPSFNYVLKTENVDGRSGAIYKGRRLESYSFDIPLVVRNDYLSHNGIKTYDDVLNELVKFFNYEEQVKLQFKSKDWYWNAYFEGPIKLHKEFTIPVKFTIKVVLTDPYKYSVTGNKNTAISDQVSVVNSGTADTPLIVEARAIKPSSYFMITKNDEDYFMVGDDEVTKEVKDYMPPVYHSEFRDFKGWTKMITEDIPSNDLGGKVGGDFVISNLGEGYKATNFPDAKGWVGAGTKRG